MFGQRPLADMGRVLKGSMTNLFARLLPKTYFSLVKETGRGPDQGTERSLAEYCFQCVDDYLVRLGGDRSCAPALLAGRNVVELGPGDFPGVAVLLVAFGASKVICVDRFPLMSLSDFNVRALQALLGMLDEDTRDQAGKAFVVHGRPESGIASGLIEYVVADGGLVGRQKWADLILSRAVLEHVNRLNDTFRDMGHTLKPGGRAVHLVDLRSHRLHRKNPLDFLTWPDRHWDLMFSFKGAPNRARVPEYREAATRAALKIEVMEPVALYEPRELSEVRPYLPKRFASVSDEELAWQAFWMVCRAPESARAEMR